MENVARGPVRHCGRQDDRKHHAGYLPTRIYVRRHRCPII